MSYTTGEIAALCGVTVRAVQFYDKEGLLKPDGLSEGGRRLYGDESVKTLQIICTYKSLGLSLSEIKRVTSEKDGGAQALLVLLENKEKELGDRLDEIVSQRDNVRVFKERLKSGLAAPSQALCDVRKIMESKKRYQATIVLMSVLTVLGLCAEIAFTVLWIVKGWWLPFAVGMPCLLAVMTVAVVVWMKNTAYVCRECGKKFVPKFWAAFFAPHTPKTRKLTCPHCGAKKYHFETYRDE